MINYYLITSKLRIMILCIQPHTGPIQFRFCWAWTCHTIHVFKMVLHFEPLQQDCATNGVVKCINKAFGESSVKPSKAPETFTFILKKPVILQCQSKNQKASSENWKAFFDGFSIVHSRRLLPNTWKGLN